MLKYTNKQKSNQSAHFQQDLTISLYYITLENLYKKLLGVILLILIYKVNFLLV